MSSMRVMARSCTLLALLLAVLLQAVTSYKISIEDSYGMRQTCNGVRAGPDTRVDGT